MKDTTDFWSRRRTAVLEEAASERAVLEADAVAQQYAALEELSEAEILEQLDLPDPDTLQQGDDFSAFLAKVVPETIRRRALRTLWRSNPVLANVDMLVDYGEDFTDSATVVENMQTAYQIGKGMKSHIDEMVRQVSEQGKGTPEEDDAPESMAEADVAAEEPSAPTDLEPSEDGDAAEPDLEVVAMPRRMTFQIEETA